MNKIHAVPVSIAFTAVLISPTAWSVSLTEPVGSFADFAIPGTTVAARPELAGIVLEDLITPFSFSGAGETISGEIQNRVVRSNADNTLDFYWRIRNLSGNGDISAFRVDGFSGFTLDADWRIDGLGNVAPDIARYFGSAAGAVNFLFNSNEVGPNEESYFFFLDTQAKLYSRSGRFDLLCAPNDCISPLMMTFAPVVPIPPAVWLLGSGLLGLLAIARRRRAISL